MTSQDDSQARARQDALLLSQAGNLPTEERLYCRGAGYVS